MKNQIEVKTKFRSGHRLLEPYKGKCNNPHGEGFTAVFLFEGKTDNRGLIADFSFIKKKLKEWVDANLDHAYVHRIDDFVGLWLKSKGFKTFSMATNPTSENIANLLFRIAEQFFPGMNVIRVGIIESFDDNIAWSCEEERV